MSSSDHPDNDHVDSALPLRPEPEPEPEPEFESRLAAGSRPSSISSRETLHLQTPPTSPRVQPLSQPIPIHTYALFSRLDGNRAQFDAMLELAIEMIDDGLEEERGISQHLAAPLFESILRDQHPRPDQPRAGFVAELDLAFKVRVPNGATLAETRINRVLRLLYRLTRNRIDSNALIQKLDVAIHVATCLPIRLHQGSSASSPRESQRSAKRRRREEKQQQRDAMFWAVVLLLLELKLFNPRVGLAQTCSYALINWDMSGARAAVYMYRTGFTFMLVVDDQTLVIETSDARQWGTVTRISDIQRFAAHMLPYQLAQQDQATEASLAPQINQGHANILYDFVYDHAVIAQSLPVDNTISRNDIVNWTQPSMDACLAEIGATVSRSSWQLPHLADKAVVSSLTSNNTTTASAPVGPLRELASICGLTRPSDLVKKLKELFPDFEASEDEQDAEDEEREPKDESEGYADEGGDTAAIDGGNGDGQGDAGEGGDTAGGDGPGASKEGGGESGVSGGAGAGAGAGGGSQSQYGGHDQRKSGGTSPSSPPPPVDDCDGEPDVQWSGIGWRASQEEEQRAKRPMELESDYDPCSDDDDDVLQDRRPDPIKLARKRRAFTPANALTATMDLLGVKVVWARPGTATRALRAMRAAIELAGSRTPTPRTVATFAAVQPTVLPPLQAKVGGTDDMHEHGVNVDPEASFTDGLGYNCH